MNWLTRFWQWLGLPEFESAPGNWALLFYCTIPLAALMVFGHWIGCPPLWRAAVAFIIGLVVRYSPWFRRPESVHINLWGGWMLGEIAGLWIWHHP